MDSSSDRQFQVRIDESKMQSTYANVFRSFNLSEGMVVDFGLNLPAATQPGRPQQTNFAVGSRIIMSWAAAKQLAATVSQSVQAYEDRFGEIPAPGRGASGGQGSRLD